MNKVAKTILAAIISVTAVFSLSACSDGSSVNTNGPTISIGVKFDQPGVSYKSGSTYSGFDIDVARYVANYLGYASGQIVDEYPAEGVRKVREFLDENKAVEVSSEFLKIFDIARMVVTRFSLKQETASNRQTLEVKALSDVDYEIKNTEY